MRPDVLHGALAAGGVGVWVLDPATGHAEWSETMADLHGVDRCTGPVGAAFEQVEPDDRRGLDEVIAHGGSLDDATTVEYRVRLADDRTRWVSSVVTSVEAPDGVPTVCLVATDVTDRTRHDLDTERRRKSIESLHWVNRAIIAGRGLGDTARALVDSAAVVLGASAGILVYVSPDDNGGALARSVTGLDEADVAVPRRLDWPWSDDAPLVVDDLAADAGVAEFLGSVGFPASTIATSASALLVPVGASAQLGAFCFVREDVGYFSDDDAELAAAIGSAAVAAIESAQQFEEQRLAARTFQRHLLPASGVEVPGVELCTQYHPGRDGLDVGGDWFDVIDLGPRLGLAVGDVCGHGLEAAAHMGQLRHSFRALVRSRSTPEEALGVLNQIALELHTTATVAYVELDVHSGVCAAWRCGHLPPVVASADGSSRWIGGLGAAGPMLGFVDEVACPPVRTNLASGDVLLLYTDGLVERRGELIDDGLDRLAAALHESLPIGDLDARCGVLYETLAALGPDSDDIAMVAVRRTA